MKKKTISRRDFLKGSAAGAASLAAAGLLAACGTSQSSGPASPESSQPDSTPAPDQAPDIGTGSPDGESIQWDYETDVVVIGAGGSGLPAALKAMEDGAGVIIADANWDVGGHAAISEGNLHFGGGTEIQKRYGIEDSADQYYLDHTVGIPLGTKFNDRDYVRAIADNMVSCYDMCMANGLLQLDAPPEKRNYYLDGAQDGTETESVPRQTNTDAITEGWENDFSGKNVAGIGITRPLERSLRKQGAQFLLNYHMDKIYRQEPMAGKVLGIMASYTPHIMPGQSEPLTCLWTDGTIETTKETVNIRAKKGVIIATGGSIGNELFRTMIDPRLGPEFDGLGGMPFSDQDASGELAAMEIGASLGVMANYQQEGGGHICTPKRFGCRYGYGSGFSEKSKVWPLVHANGIAPDWSSLCIVNMLGQRCGNEDLYNTGKYTDYRYKFFSTAFASVVVDPEGDGNAHRYGGPIWAVFDQAAADRNDWDMVQGIVDFDDGYAFKGDTLEELAANVINKYYENIKMDPIILRDTIERYNSYVDTGVDLEWGRTDLGHKIQQGPFYAVWAMPNLHDTFAGLRVNSDMQVQDIRGNLIPGLFCCGESSGGMRVHGLGRVMVSGYIAGRSAASLDDDGNVTVHSLKKEHEIVANAMVEDAKDAPVFQPRGENDEAAAKEPASADTSAAGTVSESETGTQVFTGTSDNGMGGAIQLQISVENGKMTAIEVLKQSETEGIGVPALDTLIEEALEKQSAKLDAVSGATITSDAFMEALAKAMEKAGL